MRTTFNLLGPQGSGKGTQADALLEIYDFTRFDLGENLREIEESESELGKEITEYLHAGRLVPAQLIAEVTKEKLVELHPHKDILFDGLMRALDEVEAQKETFASLELPMPVIIFLNLDEETAIDRLSKRRICAKCHARYTTKPDHDPATLCPRCGGRLTTRHDDTPEAIAERLSSYHKITEPVVDYFRTQGTVLEIDASPSIEAVTSDIVAKVDAYYQAKGSQSPRK